MRPQWLIDLHDEFPGSAIVAAALDDALIVEPRDVMTGRWPAVQAGRTVVAYGTMPTMRSLRRVRQLGEAVFDDYTMLRCSFYYRHVYDLLGRTAVLVPFSAVPARRSAACSTATRSSSAAIRTTNCSPQAFTQSRT